MIVVILVTLLVIALVVGLAIVYQMGKPVLISDGSNPVKFDANGNPVTQEAQQGFGQRLKNGWQAIWWGQNLDEKQKRMVTIFKVIFYSIVLIVFLILLIVALRNRKPKNK